jgi:hypothetical protein
LAAIEDEFIGQAHVGGDVFEDALEFLDLKRVKAFRHGDLGGIGSISLLVMGGLRRSSGQPNVVISGAADLD